MTALVETIGHPSTADLKPSTYLTDGRRLFRVVRGFTWPPQESQAVLEDCRSLEERSYSSDQLSAMGLSVVRPSA